MDRFYELQETLSTRLNEITDESKKIEQILTHLNRASQIPLPCHVSKLLRNDQDWLNTECPLSWEVDLQGRVLVLDFFTYCCVNCLHLLPTLKRLEEKFPLESGLIVVGVHSAKFLNEKSLANVASAILQNNITHCVVNDPNMELWNQLHISCWPTLFLLGPSGQPLFILMGESQETELFLYCRTALDFFQSSLCPRPLPMCLLKNTFSQSILRFPGKVTVGRHDQEIVLTDTGNNRILILTSEGVIKEIVGGPELGFQDGDLVSCRFNRPQGAAVWKENWIFVADTENHAIRLIDLSTGRVTTVVGTGQQGLDQQGGQIGTQQLISTPWDLCIAPPFGTSSRDKGSSVTEEVLYIAMAGLHQIWAYFLHDCKWLKHSETIPKGSCLCVAGCGKEENRNNAYPLRAGFAQPSGLAYSPSMHCLFVADSESSTIRSISLQDGGVKGLVGGSRDPSDLFAFGDQDGTGLDAKLQHPLGVAWCQSNELLYVADTYNHKLKVLETKGRFCKEVPLECPLHEPGGICALENGQLFLVDTQAHALLKIYLGETKVAAKQLPIVALASTVENCIDESDCSEVKVRSLTIRPGATVTFVLFVTIQEGLVFSQDAPQTWTMNLPGSGVFDKYCGSTKGKLNLAGSCTEISVKFPGNIFKYPPQEIRLSATCYICDKALNVCLKRDFHWAFSVTDGSLSAEDDIQVKLLWNVTK